MYTTIAEVKRANQAHGHHYFERSTMRFFDSRIESRLYGGRYFITSEQFHGSQGSHPRRYTIRIVQDDGTIDTAGGHAHGWQAFSSKADAQRFLRAFIRRHSTCPLTSGKALDLWEAMHAHNP